MRIILANHTPIVGSGSGTYTAMLAQGLRRAGHEICVLTPLADRFPIGSQIECYSLELEKEEFPSFTGHPLSAVRYDHLNEQKLRSLLAAWRDAFLNLRKKWTPDIVHVQHLWVVAQAALLAGLRPVVTCHGSEIKFAVNNSNVARIAFPNPKELGAVINISNYVCQQSSCFIYQTPFQIILPNPYDDELFYFEPERCKNVESPHLGFVGRLVPYKNCDQFLKCIAHLKGEFPILKASIIGDSPNRRGLEDMVNDLNLSEVVRFIGQVEQGQLRQHYHGLDVLIVPSSNEPFGLVALESVACGTPAVVAKSGGIEELIQPPFIMGFEVNNIDDLKMKVTEVLGQVHDTGFGVAANKYVRQQYSLRSYIQRLEEIYHLVIHNNC